MKSVMTIRQALVDALKKEGLSRVAIPLEHTADLTHGDYASSIALAYAKELGTNPRALAERLIVSMGEIEGVSKIDIAGPGFINFTLAARTIVSLLEVGRKQGAHWGYSEVLKGEEILIEYTSPNLFKPLHIGNLVGNVIGESLSRLFESGGADVRRINYPSDIGLTVAKGVWGLQNTGGDPKDIRALGEAYRVGSDAYEHDPVAKEAIEAINKQLYHGSDPHLNTLRDSGKKTSKKHLDELCRMLGTKFDTEIYESEAGPVGQAIVESHVGDVFEKSDGATIFPGEKYGLHTRVFLNSMGLPTYEAKDLGNFELKRKAYPHFARSFVVTGVEQQEYFKVVIAAIKKLFPEEAEKTIAHIATGFLSLTTGKMSSRKGNVLTGEDLINDLKAEAKARAQESRADDVEELSERIAVAALKFQILKGGASKNIVFDHARALSLEGDSGPYLQYTHARTHAVVEKAKEAGITAGFDSSAKAHELARLLTRFHETVARSREEYEPHHVANYLISIAAAFNSWYAQEQILDGTPAASHKVALADITRITLKNGLSLLGIPAPEQV